jgi:hypothetical protein
MRPKSPPNRVRLSEFYVRQTEPRPSVFNAWDTHVHGLVLQIQPSGHRSFRFFYRCNSRSRWYHIGDASAVSLSDARKKAITLAGEVAFGKDPVADRDAERNRGTFTDTSRCRTSDCYRLRLRPDGGQEYSCRNSDGNSTNR